MKRSVLFLTTASMLLAACDNSTPPPKPVADISTTMESEEPAIQSQEVSQLRAENDDLRNELAKLQAIDPTVKDAYYGVDEKGERVLNVVREETNGASASSLSSTVWPLLGGMAAGAVIAKMASSGGVSNYASYNPPARAQSFYSRDDERAERNRAYDSYRNRYQNQAQPKQAYNSYTNDRSSYNNDRNSFNQPKPAAVVQRTVNVASPSTAVASDQQKISQYYAPTRQAAPSGNDYSRQNATTSYQPAKISTRIEPAYKAAPAPAYKAPAYQAPKTQAYQAPKAQPYKAPAFKTSSSSGSRRR
ncbi:hypothetical protein [Pseudomonas serbica]|jgi:hypothetical protein|uniref:hypothetical protein n=1 Tax=Pseudomonas serbica TaxID=2965074 RepID=UPI00237C3480|nr:hypothetical protein [Pseudomonas serbica]